MTRKQLIKSISRTIGVTLRDTDNPREIEAVGRTGVVLFTIGIYPTKDGWRFGGCGSTLQSMWRQLCRMGEPAQ